jgi:hypothetical protein
MVSRNLTTSKVLLQHRFADESVPTLDHICHVAVAQQYVGGHSRLHCHVLERRALGAANGILSLEIIFLKKRSGPKNGGKAIDLKQKVEVIRHQHIGAGSAGVGPERPDHGGGHFG